MIDYDKLPSASFKASNLERRDERFTSQNVYVAGEIVRTGEDVWRTPLWGEPDGVGLDKFYCYFSRKRYLIFKTTDNISMHF